MIFTSSEIKIRWEDHLPNIFFSNSFVSVDAIDYLTSRPSMLAPSYYIHKLKCAGSRQSNISSNPYEHPCFYFSTIRKWRVQKGLDFRFLLKSRLHWVRQSSLIVVTQMSDAWNLLQWNLAESSKYRKGLGLAMSGYTRVWKRSIFSVIPSVSREAFQGHASK